MAPSPPHPFEKLTPEFIMTAVEQLGFRCDCRNFPLNSYENRVYQVGIDESPPLIAKFYRPGRWNDAQLAEEHAFCRELAEHERFPMKCLAPEQRTRGFEEVYKGYHKLNAMAEAMRCLRCDRR